MAAIKTIGELRYHELQEGWTHEQLQDCYCVSVIRPQELGGGYVTIDYAQRIYNFGYGRPRQHAGKTSYAGKGWQDRILRDAIDHLTALMTASN